MTMRYRPAALRQRKATIKDYGGTTDVAAAYDEKLPTEYGPREEYRALRNMATRTRADASLGDSAPSQDYDRGGTRLRPRA